MNVLVSSEHRFVRGPDGAIATATSGDYGFWRRYLDVFDAVTVVARVQAVSSMDVALHRVEGEGVSVMPLPFYLGPAEFARKLLQIRAAAARAAGPRRASILRVPSPVASLLTGHFRREGRPFGLEVVGDPYGAFGAGAVRHVGRRFFRWWFTRELKAQCAAAAGVAYVSEGLARQYPPAADAFVTTYSSIDLPDSAFVTMPRQPRAQGGPLRLVTVGSLANMHKGVDVLLDAMAIALARGADLVLEVVGDGYHRTELAAHAQRLGLGDRVKWTGQVPAGEAVSAALDRADLFVLASRTEGLPRAMIEAMARGLPCIGTRAGGMSDLLPSEQLVPVESAAALAEKLVTLAAQPTTLAAMSVRNVAAARSYADSRLRSRRVAFYEYIHRATIAWIEGSTMR